MAQISVGITYNLQVTKTLIYTIKIHFLFLPKIYKSFIFYFLREIY